MGPKTAKICAVGTAVPESSYSQQEIIELFRVEDHRRKSIFVNSAIDRRNLVISMNGDGENRSALDEPQGVLLEKHRKNAIDIGVKAFKSCLEYTNIKVEEIGLLCCVTSTGLLTPGLSALIINEAGLDPSCARLDIVGMGCNAGLNGLNSVRNWSEINKGRTAMLLCVEICSAAYVIDKKIQTAVVNSLFADGAGALAVNTDPGGAGSPLKPRLLGFESFLIPESLGAMGFAWDDCHSKFNFCLTREVPYTIGANIRTIVSRLLKNYGLRKSEISHWIIHSGGKKVIDSIKVNLELSAHSLRHTTSVLRDHGNVSSGSFIFSYERLLKENVVKVGDYAMMITMGPGASIEAALLRW